MQLEEVLTLIAPLQTAIKVLGREVEALKKEIRNAPLSALGGKEGFTSSPPSISTRNKRVGGF